MNSLSRASIKELLFLLFLLLGIIVIAKAQEPDQTKRVKIEIEVTEDGKTTTTTNEIELDEDYELQLEAMYEDIRRSLEDAITELDDKEVEFIINTRHSKHDVPFSPMYRHRVRGHMPHPPHPPHPSKADHRTKAFLGVVTSVDSSRSDMQGVVIESVVGESAAAKAELTEGDMILAVNGEPITSHHQLAKEIRKYSPGNIVNVRYIKDGNERNEEIELGEWRPKEHFAFEDAWPSHKIKGHHVYSKMNDRKTFLGIEGRSEEEGGISVTKVFGGSTAERMGMRVGDVLLTLDGQEMNRVEVLVETLQTYAPGDRVKIEVERERKKETLKGSLQPMPELSRLYPSPPPTHSIAYRFEMEHVAQEEIESLNKQGGVSLDAQNSLEVKRWNVAPNPSEGIFVIDAQLASDAKVQLTVLDQFGRKVLDRQERLQGSGILTRIDLSQEPSGVYFLALSQEGRSKVVRIAKL